MICSTLTLFSALTVLVVVCSSSAVAEILECYECFEGSGVNEKLPVCSQLRNTPAYRVQCPNSTMCQKTVSTINLLYGQKRSTVLRGCAHQVKIVQVLKNRIFEDVAVIDEPYKDGCTEKRTHSMLTTSVEQCYCRGNLCNSGTYLDLNSPIKIIYVLFLLCYLRHIIAI